MTCSVNFNFASLFPMKYLTKFIFLLLVFSCAHIHEETFPMENTNGCFLLYNLKSKKYEKVIGSTCEERFPACSTFKVPLAVMAFDSGLLKDEKQTLKWDGQKRMLTVWNRDHNAATWMKESVVWFSQRVTPNLGEKKLKKYLDEFEYGNKDISTGITTAWLNSPNDPKGFLGLNAYEQVHFLEKLWSNSLPVSKRSMELTRKIMYLEESPKGYILSGKTGSNTYDREKNLQLGWFIAHLSKGDDEYLVVTNLSDMKSAPVGSFGGPRAKELTKKILTEAGLW
jgi:beta-lactamase class D